MKEFSFFIHTNAVRRHSPDKYLAKSLIRDALDRLALAKDLDKSQKPKYVVENAYEAIREVIDAILALEGYKPYSHEASVAYLQNLDFSFTEVTTIDRLRKQRNGIKYYGENTSHEEARQALKISEEIIQKLLKKKPELKQP